MCMHVYIFLLNPESPAPPPYNSMVLEALEIFAFP